MIINRSTGGFGVVLVCILSVAFARADMSTPSLPGLGHADAAGSLQRLGHLQQAIDEYRLALGLAEQGADRAWRAMLQGQLGGALLAADRLDEAAGELSDGLALARELGAVDVQAALLNNLAHLALARGDTSLALARFRETYNLAAQAGQPALQVKAAAGAARLLLDSGRTDAAEARLQEAGNALDRLPPSVERAGLSVQLGELLLSLADQLPQRAGELRLAAVGRLQAAADTADDAGDRRTASWAYGRLGAIYEQQQRYREAGSLTDTALFRAQQVQATELEYRWQWQRARIFAARDRPDEALLAYRTAVVSLQSIRAEFAAGDDAIAAGLREDAAPLFLALADLLLRRSEQAGDRDRAQALLREARETVELLKTAELQDYFQDDCVAAVRARISELDATIVPGTAVLYPIALPDRIELLLSLQDGLRKYTVPVSRDRLVDEAHLFRSRLEKRTTRQYLRQSRQLYSWLIEPLEQDLAEHHIDTLVLVPGAALRTVPLAALHDGKSFLIRRYAVAITPSLRLTDPRPIRRQHVSLLLNGLTESVQGFPPLVHVSSELDAITRLYGGRVYRDKGYRKAVVQRELANREYSIVHFATHGQFSGKVRDSFILTHDGRIDMDDLEDYVGVSWFRKDNPVELLTLSACETAAGDDTAALGLASVAIKAGVRSALASLWSINDQASSELVSDFYARLKDPGVSKAQALRRAQVAFLDDLRYKHPGYWAPFLLIGNWL